MIRTQIEEPSILLLCFILQTKTSQQESAVEAGVDIGCIEIQNASESFERFVEAS